MDVATPAELLHETAEHHDRHEESHAARNWWDWDAAYMDAREHASTPQQASEATGRYMKEVLHVLPG
jgi:hypothetical protein